MKNYYEILEVNPKASKEVIEKAYRVLVRKYHPDLYSGEKKKYAENKTKNINEAYKILSDEFLREQYDTELEKEKQKNYQVQKKQTTEKVNSHQENQQKTDSLQRTKKVPQTGSLGAIIQLVRDLTNDLVKSREKRKKAEPITKTDAFAMILTIIVIILLGIILWFIPFTNGWMRELLFENPLFNWIGKLFSK